MRSERGVRMATWLMRRVGPPNEALAGDLLEEYRQGRSALWYWREVLTAAGVAQSRAFVSRLRRMTKRLTGGWTVEISPRGLRAAFVFFVVFGVAIAANSPVLNAVGGGAILVALVAMSIWAVARMIRRRRITPYGQDSIMPARLKRWILDEPDEDRK